jgi:hypothetical protein
MKEDDEFNWVWVMKVVMVEYEFLLCREKKTAKLGFFGKVTCFLHTYCHNNLILIKN